VLAVNGRARQWILVGSSLGLSYAEGGQAGHQMFNTTLMEPTAYRHFVQTGQFREGTMLALILQAIGTNALPARQGQFAADVHVVEMAVKDSGRVPEGWAYYGFGGPMGGGYRSAAAPQPKASCYDCHVKHAARDNVFMQFYGLLNEAAKK
jgi:Cytochrome P460